MTQHEQKLIKKANLSYTTLVIGSKLYRGRTDRRTLYSNETIGVDMLPGDGVDMVWDITNPLPREDLPEISHIDCHSVLEHCKDPLAAADVLEAHLIMGGTLLLAVPFVWRVHAYPDDYFRFTKAAVVEMFPRIEWKHMAYVCGGKKVPYPPVVTVDDVPYFGRTEVYAFGTKI